MKASGLLAILVLLVGVVLFLFISIIIGVVVIIVGLIMMYFSRKNSEVQTGQPGAKILLNSVRKGVQRIEQNPCAV